MKKLMLKRLALFLTVFTVLFSIGAFDIYSLSDIKICVMVNTYNWMCRLL